MIQLPAGVGISFVNKVPEELIYISLKNIDLGYSSNPHGQSVEANVAVIQVCSLLMTPFQIGVN